MFGAIHGLFEHVSISNLHISPLMAREEPGAIHRRVIMDLSFPQDRAVISNISKIQYLGMGIVLTLPPIDNITEKTKRFGSFLHKIDISCAFRDYFLLSDT